jgi:COP9 signalosome complex subunit 4
LGVSPEQAEARASKMMGEGRMSGSIDQIERLIFFDRTQGARQRLGAGAKGTSGKASGSSGSGSGSGGGINAIDDDENHDANTYEAPMLSTLWDASIQDLCGHVEELVGIIGAKYPDYVASKIAI